MNASKILVIAMTGSLLAASSFAADGVKVALRLESNGQLLGTPVLMTNFGAPAAVEVQGDGSHYRIELVAKDAATQRTSRSNCLSMRVAASSW